MAELRLQNDFFLQAHKGLKRSAVRKGHRDIPLNDVLFLRAVGPPHDQTVKTLGVTVRSVTYKRFKHLTNGDAYCDGFDGVVSLCGALREIYGDLSPDQEMTVVHWEEV